MSGDGTWRSENLPRLDRYIADLQRYRMPFGRFGPAGRPPEGVRLYDLPLEYLHWFTERGGGFPEGRLGELMAFVYEVKSAGAEEIFAPLRATARGAGPLREPRRWRAR